MSSAPDATRRPTRRPMMRSRPLGSSTRTGGSSCWIQRKRGELVTIRTFPESCPARPGRSA
eukprot:1173517-Prorocentrum_minimum.AAC.2